MKHMDLENGRNKWQSPLSVLPVLIASLRLLPIHPKGPHGAGGDVLGHLAARSNGFWFMYHLHKGKLELFCGSFGRRTCPLKSLSQIRGLIWHNHHSDDAALLGSSVRRQPGKSDHRKLPPCQIYCWTPRSAWQTLKTTRGSSG